jgi:hypothetical protein
MVVGHDGIHVDANEDADVGNFFEIRPEREIARRAQIANESVKLFDVRVALKDTLKLLEQRLLAKVGEKARAHAWPSRRIVGSRVIWERSDEVIARPEFFGPRMTLLVFKSCWFIERVPSSVRDMNMLDKIRDKRTDKVGRRVAA